jgi:antitoxin MazE
MHRRIFKSGNSVVVTLPRALLNFLNLVEGCEVSVSLDKGRGAILVAPPAKALPGVDAEFGRQVAEFIDEYRPAVEHLASGRSHDC